MITVHRGAGMLVPLFGILCALITKFVGWFSLATPLTI